MTLTEELKLFEQGYQLIGGIDEAGRGPLAGPVVAACVTLTADFDLLSHPYFGSLRKIKDSKRLTDRKRRELFELIKGEFSIGIGICGPETIDRINILQASFLAMKKALSSLAKKPQFILLDGKFPIPNTSIEHQAIISGDASVFLIAAASIIAKVTRDDIMKAEHSKYPEYGFNRHKGYATRLHLAKLKEQGPCPIHRMSFEPVRKSTEQITDKFSDQRHCLS